MRIISAFLRLVVLSFLTAIAASAQAIPAPKDVIGFTPGDDRKLASWAQIVEYFKKLDAASDRIIFEEIGKTTLGVPFVYATISSPENLKNLEKYKQINAQLADPRKTGARTLLSASAVPPPKDSANLEAASILSASAFSPPKDDSNAEAAFGARTLLSASAVPPPKNSANAETSLFLSALAVPPPKGFPNAEAAFVRTRVSALQPKDSALQLITEGKTIVLISCGIHSTEVGSTLSSMLIAYKLASSNEPEIKKILDNTIILLVPSLNPDGVDIVKNWYDKTLGTKFEGTSPPELYHKYVGHDNNRDWYAFTQVETQLTVDKIHNVWHPQIVHDIHQQGQNGARLFLPPYMAPVEPNVPKQIVEGYTELGNWMANDLRKKGLQGITTNTTYDAWTPARAYSHYHGGVRILSETASANLASPITVKFENLRGGSGGLDPKTESEKFGPVWKGGEWKLRNITDYMTSAAFSLLNHAADNREKWLSRFYEIGKEAVRPRAAAELTAFVLPRSETASSITNILGRGGVEFDFASESFLIGSEKFEKGSVVIPMTQPYGAFAKALLEKQVYPDLKDSNSNPITPYDVTAHTLPLLMNVDAHASHTPLRFRTRPDMTLPKGSKILTCLCPGSPQSRKYALFRSAVGSMDEGWTRWILERNMTESVLCCMRFDSTTDKAIRSQIDAGTATIIFPDQSPNQILNGHPKGSMPDEYTGGVGKEGVENLKNFVEAGGTLVFLNRASNFAIEQFNLPIRDVTKGIAQKDFFIPGSILRTELDLTSPIAKGMPKESIAWFENSPAFEIVAERVSSPHVSKGSTSNGNQRRALTDVRATDVRATDTRATDTRVIDTRPTAPPQIRIIARYPTDPKQVLLSGWALGADKIAGKAALVEVKMGKGRIILFGFRPQYRGQSLATFPLLFNAIAQ